MGSAPPTTAAVHAPAADGTRAEAPGVTCDSSSTRRCSSDLACSYCRRGMMPLATSASSSFSWSRRIATFDASRAMLSPFAPFSRGTTTHTRATATITAAMQTKAITCRASLEGGGRHERRRAVPSRDLRPLGGCGGRHERRRAVPSRELRPLGGCGGRHPPPGDVRRARFPRPRAAPVAPRSGRRRLVNSTKNPASSSKAGPVQSRTVVALNGGW